MGRTGACLTGDQAADKGCTADAHAVSAGSCLLSVAGRDEIIQTTIQNNGHIAGIGFHAVAATDKDLTTGGGGIAVTAFNPLLELGQHLRRSKIGGIVVNTKLKHLTDLKHSVCTAQASLQTGSLCHIDQSFCLIEILFYMQVLDIKGNTGKDITLAVFHCRIGCDLRLTAPDLVDKHIRIILMSIHQQISVATGNHDLLWREILQCHIDDIFSDIVASVLQFDKGNTAIFLADLQVLPESRNIKLIGIRIINIIAFGCSINGSLLNLLPGHLRNTGSAVIIGSAGQCAVVDTNQHTVLRPVNICLDICKTQLTGCGEGQDGVLRTHGLEAAVGTELDAVDISIRQTGNGLYISAGPVGIDSLHRFCHFQRTGNIDGQASGVVIHTVDGQILHPGGTAQLEAVLIAGIATALCQRSSQNQFAAGIVLRSIGDGTGMFHRIVIIELAINGSHTADHDGAGGSCIGFNIGAVKERLISGFHGSNRRRSGIAVTGTTVGNIDHIVLTAAARTFAVGKNVAQRQRLFLFLCTVGEITLIIRCAVRSTGRRHTLTSNLYPVVHMNIINRAVAVLGMGITFRQRHHGGAVYNQSRVSGKGLRQSDITVSGNGQLTPCTGRQRVGAAGDVGKSQVAVGHITAFGIGSDRAAGKDQCAVGHRPACTAGIIAVYHSTVFDRNVHIPDCRHSATTVLRLNGACHYPADICTAANGNVGSAGNALVALCKCGTRHRANITAQYLNVSSCVALHTAPTCADNKVIITVHIRCRECALNGKTVTGIDTQAICTSRIVIDKILPDSGTAKLEITNVTDTATGSGIGQSCTGSTVIHTAVVAGKGHSTFVGRNCFPGTGNVEILVVFRHIWTHCCLQHDHTIGSCICANLAGADQFVGFLQSGDRMIDITDHIDCMAVGCVCDTHIHNDTGRLRQRSCANRQHTRQQSNTQKCSQNLTDSSLHFCLLAFIK